MTGQHVSGDGVSREPTIQSPQVPDNELTVQGEGDFRVPATDDVVLARHHAQDHIVGHTAGWPSDGRLVLV